MKKIILCIVSVCITSMMFLSCEIEVDTFNSDNRVAFKFETRADTISRYTFAYYTEDVVEHVIDIPVTAMGFLSDKPRTFAVKQSNTGVYAAKPGVHYVMDSEYVIPANETGTMISLRVLRDASLQEVEHTLEIMLVATDDFLLGNPSEIVKKVTIADVLTKPDAWGSAANYYFGQWGLEKHKVIIATTAAYDIIADSDWIAELVADYGLVSLWRPMFEAKLIEINEERAAQDLGPLAETNGTIVEF